MLDITVCEQARLARDARFDGIFFTGVLSTGIFCRPVCPARQPNRDHVVYFPTAAAAIQAGLRPCLRCRPETAPGTPAWNGTSATVSRAMHLIRLGALDNAGVDALAARLGIGSRHLRRLFAVHIGAAPLTVARLQRVFLARQLLTETSLSVSDIALASGFGSIRRFNAAFRSTYGRSPTDMRRRHTDGPSPAASGERIECTLTLSYRPPFQWERMLAFYRDRAIAGVEAVDERSYRRTIRCGPIAGYIHVHHAEHGHALTVEMALEDPGVLNLVVARLRRMFDLDANVQAIMALLSTDRYLGPLVAKAPGLRIPGGWEPFETAVRALVGQQISVGAARTILGCIAERAGTPITSAAQPELQRLFPDADTLARCDLSGLGMTGQRIQTIINLARNVARGATDLSAGARLEPFVRRLTRISGIGPWTAQYIAMRAIGQPDAFPASDLGLIRALSVNGRRPTPAQVNILAEHWRPWRAYAATYLWQVAPAAESPERR